MEQNEDARKKRFESVRYHVTRIILFVSACVCVVIGMLMLTLTTDRQSRTETVAQSVINTEQQADVLLLLSYDESNITTPLERAGVTDVMKRSSVGVDVEYMDALNFPAGTAAYESWKATFTDRVNAHGKYSTVIAADDEALSFIEENHSSLFPNTPVVFFGINDFEHAQRAAQSGYATGIIEEDYIGKTMKLSSELLPNAKKFLAIVDDTPSGVGDKAQFEAAMNELQGMNVEYVDTSTMTRDELKDRVAAAGNDTIIFYLDAANDVNGNTYTIDENAFFLSAAAKATPVFRGAIGGVGEGLCGSGFTDLEKDGQRACEMTIKILNGTRPIDIPLVTDGSGGFVFDAKVMDEFNISQSALPNDATVLNRSAFSWDSIRPLLMPIGLMVMGVLLILGFAFLGYRRSIQDTREIISQRNDLRRRFYHDQLTELPNMQWLTLFGTEKAKSDKVMSFVESRFYDFNDINDSYGHATGNAVFKEMAARFSGIDSAFLVRPGSAGLILGFNKKMNKNSKELALVKSLLSTPIMVNDNKIDLDARIGVFNREKGMAFEEMIVGVDLAVGEAMRSNATYDIVFYEPRMKDDMEQKIEITARLKEAIEEESFVVLYQPQVDAMTNEVCGYEALVRMKDDAYYPGQFIPVAEMSGLVIDVDRIVTKKVVQQLAIWKKRHKRMCPISINYSAVQLKDEGYVDFLMDLLKENDISPHYIKIEITESMTMGAESQARELFARLDAEGIPMALDDFGTGYTTLSRVSDIPASIVKIDKSLVDVYAIPGKEGFLEKITGMIHGIDKKIIVEGVETAEQLEICRNIGCDVVQGYYFSKPLLPEKASQYQPPKGGADKEAA